MNALPSARIVVMAMIKKTQGLAVTAVVVLALAGCAPQSHTEYSSAEPR